MKRCTKRYRNGESNVLDTDTETDTEQSNRIVLAAPTTALANLTDQLQNGRVELRACDEQQRWWSGIFDDLEALRASGRFAERAGFAVYTGLNPSDREVTNDIKPYRRAVSDPQITSIQRLLFDLDPVRDVGFGSSDMQLGYAKDRARVLEDLLAGYGWPVPMLAMSGNGYHLQYRCDLPNDDPTKAMLTDLYRGLGVRVSTAEVGFDTTVRNPSRICRFYGTTNRKSGRRSVIERFLSDEVVQSDLIHATAELIKPPKPKPAPAQVKRQGMKTRYLDVVGLFQELGLYKRDLGGGKHAVICIQSDRHSSQDHPHKTDTVIWEGEYPQFHCSHAHCEGVTIYDVLDRFTA